MYDSSFSLRDEFDRAELEARSNDVGLWDFEDDSSPSESDSEESESDSSGEVDVPPVPDMATTIVVTSRPKSKHSTSLRIRLAKRSGPLEVPARTPG